MNYLTPPDDVAFLRTAHELYLLHKKYTEALSIALRMQDHELIYQDFETAVNPYVSFHFFVHPHDN